MKEMEKRDMKEWMIDTFNFCLNEEEKRLG
jgi:hypothetical protein